MKNFTINAFLLFSMIFSSYGQLTPTVGDLLLEKTLTLQPQCSWITLPNPTNNSWEIAFPNKTYFNTGYDGKMAILTDANAYYPNNCNDNFLITLPWFAEGMLSFYHKFDTDTLKDGGIIEISYDNGKSWENIIDDTNHINTRFIGLYEGTITGGEYGFSGKSDGWQYVELYWHWAALLKKNLMYDFSSTQIRFRFVSDNNNTNKEGWMIDNIIFRGYDITGSVETLEDEEVHIYPNPTHDFIKFTPQQIINNGYALTLFDAQGNRIKFTPLVDGKIDVADIETGIYFYRLQKENRINTGKIIIN